MLCMRVLSLVFSMHALRTLSAAVIVMIGLGLPADAPKAQTVNYYGAPYTYSLGCTSSHPPFSSVSGAVAGWWAKYTECWGAYFPCSYNLQQFPDGRITGRFAGMTLTGRCGGGDSVYGTKYSYAPEKNLGPERCENPGTHCGNPINVSVGNKYQMESDIQFGIGFERHYNSHGAARKEAMGPAWTHTFSRRVEEIVSSSTPDRMAYVDRPEGGQVVFKYIAGNWVPDADVVSSLVRITGSAGELVGWKFIARDGREVEEYDALGRLVRITRTDGTFLSLVYNGGAYAGDANDFKLTKVSKEDGRFLAFAYDAERRVSAITDEAGGQIFYGYDALGRLSSVTYPGSLSRSYVYNESAYTGGISLEKALTGIVDESGQRYAIFKYSSDGRAVSTEHAGGVDKFVAVYSFDGAVSLTRPEGSVETRSFYTINGSRKAGTVSSRCPGCSVRTIVFSYDSAGRLDVVTDPSGVTEDYDFNARGLLTSKISAANDSSGKKRTHQIDWSSSFNVPAERRVLSANGDVVSKINWTYNARGQEATRATVDPVTSISRTTGIIYCESADAIAGICPREGALLARIARATSGKSPMPRAR